MDKCPCGLDVSYDECCGPIIKGELVPDTAEKVMRARYTAYVVKEIGYLSDSLHPDYNSDFDEKSTRAWAESAIWHGLEIVGTEAGGPSDEEGKVEFIATYTEKGIKRDYHESAYFKKTDLGWKFVSGEPVKPKTIIRSEPKLGRNDPCVCGSGKKFKKCCGK